MQFKMEVEVEVTSLILLNNSSDKIWTIVLQIVFSQLSWKFIPKTRISSLR